MDLIVTSPDPREHKRIGGGVRNFDYVIWGRVWADAVLAATFAKSTQNPAMKQLLSSTGTKLLTEARPFDPVCGIGFRADNPRGPRHLRAVREIFSRESSFCRCRRLPR